jgi:hypothetical protein
VSNSPGSFPPHSPRRQRSSEERKARSARNSGRNALLEAAKIAGGGILGIALALVILKVGLKSGWFGAGQDDPANLGSSMPQSNRIERFPSLQNPPKPRRKHPAPSAEALADVKAEIDAAFADQLSAELTPEEKRNLARKIIRLAGDAGDRPEERFALLVKAAELSIEAGDLPFMESTAATLGAEYAIDQHELTENWLREFAELADEAPEIEALVAHAKLAISRAVAEDRYDDALALADATLAACQRPAGEKVREFVREGRDRIARLRDGWPLYQDARHTLQTAPDDPEANFIAGRWLCLEKDAWNGGLVFLAKGGDHPLAEAAREDRGVSSGPASPEVSLKIADRWFELAMAEEANRGCLGRAFHWYRSAQGALDGEQATHVEQRLDLIFQEAAIRGLMPEGGGVN